VGLLDAILGRSKPKQADLDALFLVPSAAVTLQTAVGLEPTGEGSVCYRAAAGAGFAQTQSDLLALLRRSADAPEVEVSGDSFGFTWLQVRRDPADGVPVDVAALCTDLHAVNTTLEAHGFAPALLCSLVPFVDASGRRIGLVYLYKQGTFYPFAPATGGGRRRDNLLEIQIRDTVAGELPIERDLARWLAVWGAPGL
jgi:hypothetical protein